MSSRRRNWKTHSKERYIFPACSPCYIPKIHLLTVPTNLHVCHMLTSEKVLEYCKNVTNHDSNSNHAKMLVKQSILIVPTLPTAPSVNLQDDLLNKLTVMSVAFRVDNCLVKIFEILPNINII